MTTTMPLAKLPIDAQRPASDRSIIFESPEGGLALLERERERLLHELLHLPSPDLGRVELHVRQGTLHGRREELVAGLENLEGSGLVPARRVDDELREHFAFDVGRPEHVGIAQIARSRDLLNLLLHLELEVGLIRVHGSGTPDDTLARSAGDALPREIVLIRHLL